MRYLLFTRCVRFTLTAAGIALPVALGMKAHAQPPQPQAEVVAEPSAFDFQDSGRVESDQADGVEYLTRGPLHEAFASPYDADPTANPVIKQQPPNPIDEVPPEYRPSGDNVLWIPGYWSWDDEQDDFIWISGVWRDIPPHQRWVSGYWADVPNGFQYVNGFWAGEQVAEVEYLPIPPESLEQGPASPSPGDEYFYVPGNWVYQSNDYRWQPGFWSKAQQNWVWVPSQYVWTPSGCVHQNGYWDYDVAHRGVVFTPIRFQNPVYRQARYSYRPRYTIDTGLGLFVHLFVRSNQRQYFFGDYYDSRYSNTYYPWATRYQGNRYYDPFFTSFNNRSRGGRVNNPIGWITSQYQLFANNDRYRPARTISAQRNLLRANDNQNIDPAILRLTSIGESLDSLVESDGGKQNFQRLDRGEIDRVRESIAPLRQLGRDRLKTETDLAIGRPNAPGNGDVNGNVAADVETAAKMNSDAKPSDGNPNSGETGGADAKVGGALNVDKNNAASDADSKVAGNAKENTGGKIAADAKAEANTDDKMKANAKADVNAIGRGRLRLPGVSRDNKGLNNNPDDDKAKRGLTEESVGRATDRARDAASEAGEKTLNRANNDAGNARERMNQAYPSALERVGNPDASRNETQGDARNRTDNPAEAINDLRRSATERMRPARPENWPTSPRRVPSRALPNLPRANGGDEATSNPNPGAAIERAVNGAGRNIGNGQPIIGGGNPASAGPAPRNRGSGNANRGGKPSNPAGAVEKATGGAANGAAKPVKKALGGS